MKRMLFVLAVFILGAVATRPLLAQDSPFIGTWKLNTAKSKVEGSAMPKSLTRTVTADGTGLKYVFDGVAADGTAFTYSFSSNFDGKASPVTGNGMPGGADSLVLKRIDAHKTTGVLSKAGKPVGRSEAEVSSDGKSTTIKSKAKNADGMEVSSVSVFDKQ